MLIGGAITSLPVCLALERSGSVLTRHTIAVAQMAWSALLIHLSGGRIETHFHVFGSLALLAAYRDWRVLVTATVAIGCDHFIRGFFWPQSVYGVQSATPYRALEHVAWVLFEVTFLIIAIRLSVREMNEIASHRARLEKANRKLEAEFVARTSQYQEYTLHLEQSRHTLEQQAQALEIQAEQLREARAQAESASQAKSDFLANMSHEIRTPMTAVLGFADVLLANLRDAEGLNAAQTIKRNGEYLLEIINSILDLSKVEAGQLQIELRRCSPQQIVAEVLQLMRVRAEAKGLQLVAEFKGQLPVTIYTDPTRLRQILLNLVGNAIKFTPCGKIRLRVQLQLAGQPQPLLRFSLIDEGIGMTREQLEHLFQPFSQGDASMARRFGGTGLGLSISKRLAELLGGELLCTSSSPERGTTFAVTVTTGSLEGICLVRPSENCEVHPASDLQDPPLWGSTALDCNILLADDSPDNQDLVAFVLRKAGAQVTLADNGQQALDMVQRAQHGGKPYHVVLMDMEMPVLDGYAATRCLRTRGFQGAIIALTAHAMREELDKCLAAGCDAYATKPIDHDLVDLIAAHAGRAAALLSPAPRG
jgi:Amt family ammonium transporter